MSNDTLVYAVLLSRLMLGGPQAPRTLEQVLGKEYGYREVRIAIEEAGDRGHAFINDDLRLEYREEV